MAIRIKCPACDAPNTVDEEKRGRKVRCRKCDELISVPAAKKAGDEGIQESKNVKVKAGAGKKRETPDDDEDEVRPAKKTAKAAGAGSSTMLLVGGIAALLLMCLVGAGGIGGFFVFRARSVNAPEQQAQAGDANANRDEKPNANNDGKERNPNENPRDRAVINPDQDKPLPAELAPALVPRIKEATVYLRVTMPNGQMAEGSGFFALEPGIVITNAHVLGMLQTKSAMPKNVQVVANSGEPNERNFVGDVLGVDRASDLAVVRVNENNLPPPLILESKRPLVETQKVYIFGFPFGAQLGKNITVSTSSISSFRKDQQTGELDRIQVNGGMHPGNSGGPVVNSAGNLVGVSVAGIPGSQINFAVPAEKVRLIMEGRLADGKHGEAYLQGNQARLPVAFTCLDPLNRVRDMRVEVWAGAPGQPRPYSLQKPQPMPGDGPRQSHAIVYQKYAGKVDVPLPPLAPGQVYWIQPVITTKVGSTHWGTAQATASNLVPVERKAANLLINLTAQKERTIVLKSAQSETLIEGKQKSIAVDRLEATMLEVLSVDPKGAAISATYGNFKISAEEDGRPMRIDPSVNNIVRQIPPLFIIDSTNKIRARSDRNLNPKLNPIIAAEVKQAYQNLCNSLEAVTIPLPNRDIQPNEQWFTELPMMLRPGKNPVIVDLALRCNLEGVRVRNQRSEAVVTLAGNIKGRGKDANMVGGDITGKLAFDLAAGYIAQAQLTISSELSLGRFQVISAFEIAIDRQPGNPFNLPQPPEYKAGPGPVATGKTIFSQQGALTVKDPFGPVPPMSAAPNVRMKTHVVNLQAGKTYVITLNSDAFDSYLRLQNPKGQTLAEDDDSGGFPNAKIVHACTQTGAYRIVATSFDGKIGPYLLAVVELAAAKGSGTETPPKDKKVPVNADPVNAPKRGARIENPAPNQFAKGDFTLRHLTFTHQTGGKTAGNLVWAKDGKSFFMLSENGMLQRVSEHRG